MTLNSPEPSHTNNTNNTNNSESLNPQNTISAIAEFLKQHTVYDLLPISYKVILLDHTMLVKQALGALLHNGVNCAPLWNSSLQKYAGLLTTNHFITLIQHFYGSDSYEKVVEELEQFQLHRFREVEQAQGIGADPGISINPSQTVFEACQAIVKATNHTLPVLDIDPDTQQQLVVSVISQYKILKFLSINYKNRTNLNLTLQQTKIGCYSNLATAKLSTKVIDIIHIFMEKKIAAIPIVDDNGVVLNVFENNDILNLIRDGHFNNLELCVSDALQSRSESFEGVHRCQSSDTLASILQTIRKETVNRLMVVDSGDRLEGIVTLSDILNFLIQ